VYATVADEIQYYEALLTADGVSYTYGYQPQLPEVGGVVYSEQGETTGAIFEGKNGVVQIVLPADKGGTPGTKLEATSGSIGLMSIPGTPAETQLPPIYFGVDTAPDGAADGPSTTPVACDAAPATGGSTGTGGTTGGDTSGGGTSGGGTSGGGTSGGDTGTPTGGQPAQASELRLSLAKATLSARKAKKSAKLGLRSSEYLTDVTVKLKRGSKTLASLTLPEVATSETVKFKLKKALKKGAHKLVVSGKRTNGSAFTKTLALKVTR
jgi:hypothetical protein